MEPYLALMKRVALGGDESYIGSQECADFVGINREVEAMVSTTPANSSWFRHARGGLRGLTRCQNRTGNLHQA